VRTPLRTLLEVPATDVQHDFPQSIEGHRARRIARQPIHPLLKATPVGAALLYRLLNALVHVIAKIVKIVIDLHLVEVVVEHVEVFQAFLGGALRIHHVEEFPSKIEPKQNNKINKGLSPPTHTHRVGRELLSAQSYCCQELCFLSSPLKQFFYATTTTKKKEKKMKEFCFCLAQKERGGRGDVP
jgi:hypothetical protein